MSEAAGREMSSAPARILVVDDQRVQREKLSRAVAALGHDVESVDGGAAAVARLVEAPFDLVLLDILMPDMDGFAVLRFITRDRRTAGIPVIVVSALEDDLSAVVRAIEMGAEDMLPKRFDRVLLEARLTSALRGRTRRLRERDHREHMTRLVDAAALLERHAVAPARLGLDETCARDDAIGRLARVFLRMTDAARARDAEVQAQLDRLRTAALVVGAGTLLGLVLPLARAGLAQRSEPFGLALWASATVALLCLSTLLWSARARADVRRWLRPSLGLAVGGGLCGVVPLIWLLERLPPATVATLLPLELLAALALHRARGLASRRRGETLTALVLGTAIVSMLWPSTFAALGWTPITFGIAAIVPLGFAFAAYALDVAAPSADEADGPSSGLLPVGLAALATTLVLVPLTALGEGDLALLVGTERTAAGVPVVVLACGLLAAVLAAALALRVHLIRVAGTLASAAVGTVAAVAALVWSALLLDDAVTVVALVPIVLGGLALSLRGTRWRSRRVAPGERLDVELV